MFSRIDRTQIDLLQERLAELSLDGSRLFVIIKALQSDKRVSASDRRKIADILDVTSNFGQIDNLSSHQVYFLNRLIEKYFDVNLLGSASAPYIFNVYIVVRRTIFCIIGIVCLYVLVSALLLGYSSVPYFSAQPMHAIIAVLLLMAMLFLLEGTQISITSLRLKDIDLFDDLPLSVKRLQAHYRSERNVRDYLAGRQLLTIVTVFFISRICSFPDLTIIPGFGADVPGILEPWFSLILFDFGVLAALVTLWLAQLSPQFLANKRPIDFLTFPLAKMTVSASRFLESIGITDPGYVITHAVRPEGPIPTSTRENYNTFLISKGYAATGIEFRWIIDRNGMKGVAQEHFVFDRSGIAKLDVLEEIQGRVSSKKASFRMVRNGSEVPLDIEAEEEIKSADHILIRYIVRPKIGSFEKKDLVTRLLEVSSDDEAAEFRQFYLSRPVRYLLISLECAPEVSLGQPGLEIIDEYHYSSRHDSAELFALEKVAETKDRINFAYFKPFPNIDNLYRLKWGREG